MTMDIEQTYQHGFQLRCEGNYSEARQVFQRVLSHNPLHAQTLHQLALIDGFEGDFDGSLQALANLVAKFPGNLDFRYDFAMTQMMLGMYEEACENLRYILQVNPTHEKALQQSTYC